MKKLHVMTVVGTRPEIIRLSRVMAVLDRETKHTIVHTGQNYDYELNQIFFDELKIRKPDHFLNAARETAAETIGHVIIETDKILARESPDALLVLGDTNSCLAVIPAKRRKIPIFHMEAGNRCFDMRVPEEINRRIVDHTADINLPYSTIARDYLLAEGIAPDRVIKTGSPMFEVLHHYMKGILASKILGKLKMKKGNYFLVSCHREENVDSESQFKELATSINTIAKTYNLPVLVSTHPRTKKRIEQFGITFDKNVNLLKPFGFLDYNALQMNARAVLSDSGTISEESSILNFPAINIREAHERPEAMEEASVIMAGLKEERILQALTMLENQNQRGKRSFNLVEDYASPNVSEKVARIILSYTDYVNRVVWKQY
jgi:UDP-N-acetyl-L-fucosamine synthase